MSLQKIRQKIIETEAQILKPIDELSKAKSGLEAAKNQAVVKLDELRTSLREEVRKNTKLYLVYGPGVVFNVNTPSNVFVMNHKDLAYKLSTGVINAIRPNTGLTAYHITPLNEMLMDIGKEIGLKTEYLPALGMQEIFMNAIQGRDHLVDTIEAMLEYYMKSNEEEKEGHAVQSVYLTHNYLNLIEKAEVDSDLKLFVFVPSLSREIKASYGRFLTDNIETISFSNRLQAEQYMNSAPELQEFVNSLVTTTSKTRKKGK